MTPGLNAGVLARMPGAVGRTDYDFLNSSIGIVHLGLGAFHRAHQALYTEDGVGRSGGDWGILGASLRHADVPSALAAQQQLYTVETLGSTFSYQIVAAIRASLTATTQRAQLLSALSSPRTHIITLTVTEKGYCLGLSADLDVANAEIAHDLEYPGAPSSTIGWLAAGLEERDPSHPPPLTIISCDNLQANGAKLRRAVTTFVARRSPGMLTWLPDNVAFPHTVVGCLVPPATHASP